MNGQIPKSFHFREGPKHYSESVVTNVFWCSTQYASHVKQDAGINSDFGDLNVLHM